METIQRFELGSSFNSFDIQKKLLDNFEINNLIAERDKARSDKNFKLADEIRDKLKEMGVSIEDSNSGTKWRVD